MSEKKRTKRAPRGYRIVLWADGFYHVYHGGVCIDETLSRFAGIFSAKQHAAQHHAHLTPESLASSQEVFNASALEQSDGDSSPAQAQVA